MEFHFAGSGGDVSVKLLIRYWLARAKVCLDRTKEADLQLAQVIKDLHKQNKPRKFSPGPGNILVEHKASFEKTSALIEKNYGRMVKDLTFYEYYSRIKSLEEEFKRQADGLNK